MLIRKKITALIFSLVSVIFLLPSLALAQDVNSSFGTGSLDGLVTATTRSLFDIVTGIVNTALYFLGAIAILLFMYAGYLWFISRGNREQIDKAKKIMVSAVIGLAIIFSSYAIVNWLFKDAIQRAFNENFGGGGRTYGGGVGLGGGVIESHYPEPNATGVPRNTNIFITFKEPMRADTIASSSGCTDDGNMRTCNINTTNILLHKSSEAAVNLGNMTVTYDYTDPKVFEFNPYGAELPVEPYLLGEQTKDTKYQMLLKNLITGNGQSAFRFGSYSWYFTVGTYIDNTPPRVVSVRPRLGADSARNAIVQINFSEPVNPTLATGLVPGYNNIRLVYTDATGDHSDAGRYTISNQYRTVEFIPNQLCGQNSCGYDIFCLTGNQRFVGTVTTNIKDMVGNALAADYTWNFQTLDNIDTDPPKMISMMSPRTDVNLTQPVAMTFNKTLLSSSIKSSNIQLLLNTTPPSPMNYWLRTGDAGTIDNSVVYIYHERFDVDTSYLATSTSGIMDSNQNCWYPCLCDDPTGNSCYCSTPGACVGTSCQVPIR